MALTGGSRLGSYEVISPLGAGGMGEVYRARDLRLRREVAIKVLPANLTADRDARERLEREAVAAAALDHPFICKVFEIGEHADALFVVMELVPGETLQVRLAAGAVPWDDGLRIAGEMAEALEAAHARHIVHRDLKPSNIMLTPQNRVKVMDFGLAKQLLVESELTAATAARALTEQGIRLGTPDYMSPEQALGDSVDARSDLFAFGIVLSEMLTGVHPFRRASSSLTLRAILQEPPVIQAGGAHDIPTPAAMLLRRLLAKSPADRYASASEVRRDLSKLAGTATSGAAAPMSPPRSDARSSARPLIGREVERAELLKRLDDAGADRGSVVFISGEAGIGKTRLIQEVSSAARERGFMTVIGHCYEMEGTAPYVPFVEMLEYSARVLPPSTFRHALGDSASEVAKLMPELRRVFPDIPKPVDLPPEQQRRFLFNAYREFVERACRMTPLAVVLEDLHWADEPTVLLLQHLAHTVSTMPLLIVGTYRDVELDATRPFARGMETMVRQRQAARLALRRLPVADVESLLTTLSGQTPPSSLTRVIFNETEGNPFFVEEVFQHLAEDGVLFDAAGAWRELRVDTLQVPDSVRLVISRRLERLKEPTRRVLTTAALIGRVFSLALLEALEPDPDAVLDAIEEAERAHLVIAESSGREPRYRFAHEPIRQTLAEGLSLLRRQRLHLRIGDAFERVYAGSVEKHAPALAHHFNRAGGAADLEKTVKYLILAAEHARASAAHEESLAQVDNALALLEGESSGRVGKLHALRAKALSNLGRSQAAIDSYEQAIGLFERAGDVVAAAMSGSALAALHVWNADGRSAITATQRALDGLGDAAPALRCQLLMGLARSKTMNQEADAGFAALERAREVQQSIRDARLDRRAIAFEAHMQYQVLHLERSLALAQEAVERAHAAQEVWLEVDTAWLTTLIPMFTGRTAEARRLAEERVPLAERIGHHSVVWLCRRTMASVAAYSGRLEEAERAGREVMGFGRAMKIPWAFHDNVYLAIIAFLKDHQAEALTQLQTAIALEPASYQQGMSAATRFWIRAHLHDTLAIEELQQHRPPLPERGSLPTYGAWVNWSAIVEGLALLDRTSEAASMYWAVDDLLATGAICGLSHTLFKTAAGVAADCAGDWTRGEDLHQHAVREADAAYPLFQADARIWYAAMLVRRNTSGDRVKAAELLTQALSLAERFEMAAMARRASNLLGVAAT